MIKLDVHDYCHECPEFTPDAMKLITGSNIMVDCVVRCENHFKCDDIARRIEASMKEKKDGSLADARKDR